MMADRNEAVASAAGINDTEGDSKTVEGDARHLPSHLKGNFIEADKLIQAKYGSMQKQQDLLRQAKDQALHDVDSCFDRIVHVANRRRQLLKSEISDVFGNHLESLLEDSECVLLARMCLGTLLKQAKEMSAATQAEKPGGWKGMVEREIQRHCDVALQAFPGKNLIEFDKTFSIVAPMERKLQTVGRIKVDHTLPALVRVRKSDAIVGISSTVHLEIVDLKGEPMSSDLIRVGLVSFELRDSVDDFVQYEIDTNLEECVILRFKPTMLAPHSLSVLFCATVLKEVTVPVSANRPELVIGGNGGLMQPNSICLLDDGSLCVVDSGAATLCLFDTSTGSLKGQTMLLDGNHIPFDVAVMKTTGVLYCTGSTFDDQDDTLSASPDDGEGLLPIDSTTEESKGPAGKAPAESKPGTTKGIPAPPAARLPDLSMTRKNSDDLKIYDTTFQGFTIKCVEKPAYIAINAKNQIILSDPNANAIFVFDSEGCFLQSVPTLNLDCPAFLTSKPEGQIILSDVGSGSLLVGSVGTGLRERWGTLETDAGSQLLPVGLAVDTDGNLIVGDGSGPRLFIYGEWGECLGKMVLAPAEINEDQGQAAGQVEVSPWGLAAAPNRRVWVIDSNSRRVCKYRYSID